MLSSSRSGNVIKQALLIAALTLPNIFRGGLVKHFQGLVKHMRGLVKHFQGLVKHIRGLVKHFQDLEYVWEMFRVRVSG